MFPDALVRPHLSHIGQIVVPLLSLKSLCYQSNRFVWIVLSHKSFSDFIIITGYSYVWCLLLVNFFHLCLTPSATSLRLVREPVNRGSDCASHEKAHRSVCRQNWFWSDLYLMSIKYYQLGRNLLWPQPIKIAKQKQSFQNWRHRGKDVRNSQRKAFYLSIYTGQNGFFISVISEMINGERSEMTGLKLTLIGVPLKMLYPWVSSSSLCADRTRVSHIYV